MRTNITLTEIWCRYSMLRYSSSRFFANIVERRVPVTTFTRLAMSTASAKTDNLEHTVKHNSTDETYENAVKLLNSLQSNAQTIARIRENPEAKRLSNFPQTVGALQASGLSLDILDTLNIVHVAGSKGKGMTCAFTESILRHAGLRTGFFSSPHLTAVRERIRIDGRALKEEAFAKYFFTVYNRVRHLKEPNALFEMPHYFRFLTCMAFHVFLAEKVDAVILEVGLGGLYDTTNIIRKPVVVGITTLCLDHQAVLGNTLEEIAIQKAGIMKENVPAYTVATHPPHIYDLLQARAREVKCPLHPVQKLDTSELLQELNFNDGFVTGTNAGLAVYLANEFLSQKFPHIVPPLPSSTCNGQQSSANFNFSRTKTVVPFHLEALRSTKWDGRFQILRVSDHLTYYLDGAHTLESLKITTKWFQEITSESNVRILVFNVTGQRSSVDHLKPIADSGVIDLAVFCPCIASRNASTVDNWSALENEKDPTEDCKRHAETWESLQNTSPSVVFPDATQVTSYIEQMVEQQAPHIRISVLITGSLHLVGSFLCVLDPNRNDE